MFSAQHCFHIDETASADILEIFFTVFFWITYLCLRVVKLCLLRRSESKILFRLRIKLDTPMMNISSW
jgi:hypothetical protein